MTSSARALLSAAVLSFTLPALCTTTHHKQAPSHHTAPAHRSTHATSHAVTHSTSHSSRRSAHTSRTSAHAKPQHAFAHVAMTTERATQIQTALIKQGYLTGEPTGNWDAASISAMQKLQADNGWQTKIMPDSRALIKLGLGPNSAGPSE